jgi:hypothetical protein
MLTAVPVMVRSTMDEAPPCAAGRQLGHGLGPWLGRRTPLAILSIPKAVCRPHLGRD